MAKNTWLFMFAALVLSGCASTDTVDLLASDGQQAIKRDGSQSLISAKRNVVMLQGGGEEVVSSDRPNFVIAVQNMQPNMVEFAPSRVSARTVDSSGQVKPLKVFSYAELVAEEKRRQTAAAIGVALLGASRSLNASNAGYSQTHGTFNAYNNYGGSAYGNYNSTTYNAYQAYSAQQLASAQTSADFANIRAEGARNLVAMKGSIIREHTLRSGEWYGGTVVLDVPKKDRAGTVAYLIDVNLDGETHTFSVRQSKSVN